MKKSLKSHQQLPLMGQPLAPAEKDVRRVVSIDRIRALIGSSTNPTFVQHCQAFIESFESGDLVVEFCTSKKSWRECMGRSGFLVERQGTVVFELVTRFN